MGETHLSIQCVKFHSSTYSSLTKGVRGTASAPYHSPCTQSSLPLSVYLRAQRVFRLVLPARFLTRLLPCCRAPAARPVAEGLLEFGDLLVAAGGQQGWNLQLGV